MCIAAVIFKPLPLRYLTEMDNDNPHGGGIACVKEGRIWFLKGLDAKAIYALQESQVLTYPYLLHFRWATMGAKVAENCHPFVVGPRAVMGETCGFAERVLIHNGSWHTYQRHIPLSSEVPDAVLKHVSDTALAAWLLADNPDLLDEVPWATAVAEMKDGEMDITTRGTWTDHQGSWYSNLNWLPTQDQNWNKWWETSRFNRPAASEYVPAAQTAAPPPPNKGLVTAGAPAKIDVPWSKSPVYDSWEDYVRAKYGDETATLIADDTDEETDTKLPALKSLFEELADLDLVSEDHNDVNAYLAKQMLKDVA